MSKKKKTASKNLYILPSYSKSQQVLNIYMMRLNRNVGYIGSYFRIFLMTQHHEYCYTDRLNILYFKIYFKKSQICFPRMPWT